MRTKKRAQTSVRRFIWIRLLNAERQALDSQDLLTRVRAAFACNTVVVTKENSEFLEKEERVSWGYTN